MLFFIINTNAQFVKIEKGQFKLNGNDFYPVVMNYSVEIARNYLNNNYFISPGTEYDNNSQDYETGLQAGLKTQMIHHFQKCLSMGFNCVRFGIAPAYLKDGKLNGGLQNVITQQGSTILVSNYTGFTYRALSYNHWWVDEYIILNHPYSSDLNTIQMISLLKIALDAAQIAGIKVILLAGCPYWGDASSTITANAVNDYAEYLSVLANELKDYSCLMAYDLINEPDSRTNDNSNISKPDVCNFTDLWYKAIKDYDQNHLVTMGVGNIGSELQHWDVSLMNLDFISPHIYPYENEYEIAGSPNGYSRSEAYERWQAQVYWIAHNMTKPWIIGETGFSALNDISSTNGCTSCCSNSYINCKYTFPPFEFGNEAEQKDFCHNSQQYVWDCGGNGYSYWAYQGKIYADGVPDYYKNEKEAFQHYWPILYSDKNYDASDIDKPAVDEFKFFKPYLSPRNTINLPNNYYDPCHTAVYSQNVDSANIITGKVEDINGNAIKDAIIWGRTFTEWGYDADNNPYPKDFINYTFTKEDGTYTIVPFNYKLPTTSSVQFIRQLSVSAIGTSNENYNDWSSYSFPYAFHLPLNSYPIPSNQYDFTIARNKALKRIITKIDETIENVTVHSGETFHGQGFNLLTVSPNNHNVIIENGGIADFKARNEVVLLPGFAAKTGSDVDIFNDVVKIPCAEVNNAGNLRLLSIDPPRISNNSLELIFTTNKHITVYPNPSTGYITVQYYGGSKEAKELKIFNAIGKEIYKTFMDGNSANIDLSEYPKAFYYIQINDTFQIFNQKIIIN